jgi:hypothetical protein
MQDGGGCTACEGWAQTKCEEGGRGRGGQRRQWGISLAPEGGVGGGGREAGVAGPLEKRGDVGSHIPQTHIF